MIALMSISFKFVAQLLGYALVDGERQAGRARPAETSRDRVAERMGTMLVSLLEDKYNATRD